MRNKSQSQGLGCLLMTILILMGTLWYLNREPEPQQDEIQRIPIP